ncbi:hypothetical protein BH23ACT2_BH23ACT2_05190 [soil metagenome]
MVNFLVLVTGSLVGFVVSRWLRRPERAAQAASVARNVGGSLGRRRGLSAPELQRACFSEMVRHVRVDRQGRTLAPARYLLHLHPDDLAVIDEARRWFTDGLVAALHQAAGDNGWTLDGAVEVGYRADPARRLGAPAAHARAHGTSPADPTPAPPIAPRPSPGRLPAADGPSLALVLVRGDTGERIPLLGASLSVGRSRDRDVTIDDTRVSRSHARFEPRQGGWGVIDEGSANGTRVSGTELVPNQPRALRPGDVIAVGPVDLRVTTAPAGGAGDPGGHAGTRALDDRDRHRISGEVLPPDRPERP